MHPSDFSDLGKPFTSRFGELLKTAGANAKPKEPALVPVAGEKSRLICEGFIGGKDVELVLVRAKPGEDGKPLAVQETLTYRQNVAGSDLVYDLTGEFMQGKARPFGCDLRQHAARLYALLPFQIENLAVVAKLQAAKVSVEVEFQNALGKRAEGALPCHAELRAPDGKVAWEKHLATSKDGTLNAKVELPPQAPHDKWTLTVRSLLSGKDLIFPLEVGPMAGK